MKNKYQFIVFVVVCSIFQLCMAAESGRKSSIALSLKPKDCVVFKEGDKCYASVKVKWKANEPGSLCLFRAPGDLKLACWKNVSEGQFMEDLVMEQPVDYYLALDNSSEILVKEKLNLSWVHKKSSRPEHTWRLF